MNGRRDTRRARGRGARCAAPAIAVAVAAAVLGAPGVATAAPDDRTPGHGDLVPTLDCLTPDGRGGFTAMLGYRNTGTATEHVSLGSGNRITPSRYDGDQTTRFRSGTHSRAFSVTVSSGGASWVLDGSTLTFSAATPATACSGQAAAPDPGEVTPLVDCIERVSAWEYTAVLGYTSTYRSTVTIPLGAGNTVLLARDTQPTSFAPGTHYGVVTVRVGFLGALWVVDGNALWFGPSSAPSCPEETEMPAEGNDTAPALALAGAAVVGALLVRRARRRLTGRPTTSTPEDPDA